jgi:hypothetical protein
MNYIKIHDNIINNARSLNRNKGNGVYELHHIQMQSVGGTDDVSNLVLLTPKEHFIIHYLLWKMHPFDRRYRDPIFMFKHKGAKNSRLYEAARIAHIIEMKTNNPSLTLSEESKLSKKQKLKEYIKTPQHRLNISKARIGKATRTGAILSSESKEKIAESVKVWHSTVGVSEETREKLRLANTGRKHSLESINKCKESAKARTKYQCPYCERLMDAGNLTQHVRKIHAEGWTAPSHEGNHAIMGKP